MTERVYGLYLPDRMPAQLFTVRTFSGISNPKLQNVWTTPKKLFILTGCSCTKKAKQILAPAKVIYSHCLYILLATTTVTVRQ